MNKRTQATSISDEVRKIVNERDSYDGIPCCIMCGLPASDTAHYIPRTMGGLGVPENLAKLCRDCHRAYDHSDERQSLAIIFREYLKSKYVNWSELECIYKKEND